jgi:hypothetical protein
MLTTVNVLQRARAMIAAARRFFSLLVAEHEKTTLSVANIP